MLFKAINSKRSAKEVLQVETPYIGLKFRNEVAGRGINEDEIKHIATIFALDDLLEQLENRKKKWV